MMYRVVVAHNGRVVVETINDEDRIIQIRDFDRVLDDPNSILIATRLREFAGPRERLEEPQEEKKWTSKP